MLFHVPVEAVQSIGPLDFFVHFTSRYESRRDIGFDSDLGQHRTTWLNRARIGFDYQPSPESNVRVTYQYSHINNKDESDIVPLGPDFNPTNDWEGRTRQDLLEANVSRTWGMSHLVVGRQVYDRDWLVGSNKWGEVGRAWTGVRLDNGRWDFFVGRLDLDTIGQTGFGSDQHLALTGYDWGQAGTTSLYYKISRQGDSVYTLGHSYDRTMGTVDFSLDAATQWGRTFGSDLSAWAGIAKAKLNMGGRMSLFGAYSVASGGTTSAGTVRTFNPLYPSDHYRLGVMDYQTLSNVKAFSFGVNYDVNEDIGLKLAYHSFTLFDEDDDWYQTVNTFNYNVGPGDGTEIGSEIDLTAHWRLNDMLKLQGGFAIFDPGSAIQNAGGGNDNQTFMYVGVNLRY